MGTTLENIALWAKVYGWVEIPTKEMTASYRRKKSRINLWRDKWGTFTVGTAIEHPIQGKTQLFRRKVDGQLLEGIFENPRIHTTKGYKSKTTKRGWAQPH